MWKIKNIFPQKANKRNWILLGLGALAISLILIFWIIAWSGADEHFLENPTIKNGKQKIVDDKIAEVYAEYSCDFKNETLIKGYIEKIDSTSVLVNDGRKQTAIFLKPDTVFVRVSIYPNGSSELAELPRTEIKTGQDIVLSVFTETDGTLYTLLVKQIELKNL